MKKAISLILALTILLSISIPAQGTDKITLAEFLQLNDQDITSITLRKDSEFKVVTNKESLARFMDMANAITMSQSDGSEAEREGGIFIEVNAAKLFYAFVSVDGAVDIYWHRFTGRNPAALYKVDDVIQANSLLAGFWNGIENNISDSKLEIEMLNAVKYGLYPNVLLENYAENITREDFCEMAFALLKKTTDLEQYITTSTPFGDVNNVSVGTLYKLGIINGKSDGIFAPKDLLTREEAAILLCRMYYYMNMQDVFSGSYTPTDYRFLDDGEISGLAKKSVYEMFLNTFLFEERIPGYVGTYERYPENALFSPQDTYTVEQTVLAMLKLLRMHESCLWYDDYKDKWPTMAPVEKGTIDNLLIDYGKSTKFSVEEIAAAMDCVIETFVDGLRYASLTHLWYDEKWSNEIIESYISEGHSYINGVDRNNVIFLSSSYDVGSANGDRGIAVEPYSTNASSWMLIRDGQHGKWVIKNSGSPY